ncbi:hypothetical protein NVIE_021690 [Nitrososphaera viennensis EN76]|uniref:Uncharacterized protein n=2 Tax=Nitrososphaera viennensis TaxID=1034015 RepID=A0A060HIP8_9ARCH|nr:hypothetical protein NVIE_021690 [Nitrososphaera viennensis EN76]
MSLSILGIFYIYTVGTFFQIGIYPLVDRVTYYSNFNFYIINEFVDHVIIGALLIVWLLISINSKIGRLLTGILAILLIIVSVFNFRSVLEGLSLISFPTIVFFLMFVKFFSGKWPASFRPSLIVNYISIVGLIVGLLGLTSAILHVAPSNILESNNYSYVIFLLFSSFSPILMLLLIMSFPIKLLMNFVSSSLRYNKTFTPKNYDTLSTTKKFVCIAICMILSVIIVAIPHFPSLNKDNQLIGVDTLNYSIVTGELARTQSIEDFLNQAFVKVNDGDRPLSLILIFSFQHVFHENEDDLIFTIEYLPLLLGPILVLVIFFLTRELTKDDVISIFASFVTAISYHVLIGTYAGFYANWFALIFGYTSFIFLLRYLSSGKKVNLFLFSILVLLTLLGHVYTWSIFVIVMGIFLSVSLVQYYIRRNNRYHLKGEKKGAIVLLAVLMCTVAIDIGRTSLTGSSSGIEKDLELGNSRASIDQFSLRWNNLQYTTTTYVGGIFANCIILGLGLYWMLTSRMESNQEVLMIIFLSMGILPFLFGQWVIQSRVLFDIPFQIPAAVALAKIYRNPSQGKMKFVTISIWLVVIAIVTVSNFYLTLPSTSPS